MGHSDDRSPSGAVETDIWRICSVLESIAANYPTDSVEAEALADAARAYTLVIQQRSLKKQYLKLRATLGGQLSEEVEQKLRQHGIDPDLLEAEDGPSND